MDNEIINGEKVYYKIVSPERWGTNMTGFLKMNLNITTKELFEKFPELIKFFPKYEKGSILKAPEGTIGFFCFDSIHYAANFMDDYDEISNCIIIKVKPTSEANIVEGEDVAIFPGCMNIMYFTQYDIRDGRTFAPPGTVGISELEVLE